MKAEEVIQMVVGVIAAASGVISIYEYIKNKLAQKQQSQTTVSTPTQSQNVEILSISIK